MGEWLTLDARAKVNLRLKIFPRDASGYHPVETVFCRISLRDRVRLRLRDLDIELRVEGPRAAEVPSGDDNLAVRAARSFFEALAAEGRRIFVVRDAPSSVAHLPFRRHGVEIELEKVIPVASGLGGGSSDAAAVLRGLNRLYGEPFSQDRLLGLAARLGSDVPFFVLDTALAFASGRGEQLRPLFPLPPAPGLVLTPRLAISTTEAYRAWDLEVGAVAPPRAVQAGEIIAWRTWGDVAEVAENDFEPVIFRRHLELAELKRRLLETGPLFAILSGSGAAFFAPYATEAARDAARDGLAAFPNVDVFPVTAPG